MILLGIKCSRTTAYHPQTNGIVEHFHLQLKAALKAQPNPDAWMDTLPLILLGIQTADLSMTAAEIVYGSNLRLPGKFISPTTSILPAACSFINQVRTYFRNIQTTKPQITQHSSHVPRILAIASHVFIQHDAIWKPLQPPHDDPSRVVKCTDKHFTVRVNGREQIMSIDHLKPAHIDSSASVQSDLSMQSTSPFIVPTTASQSTQTQIHCPLPVPPVMVVVLVFPTLSLIACETLDGSYVMNSFFSSSFFYQTFLV